RDPRERRERRGGAGGRGEVRDEGRDRVRREAASARRGGDGGEGEEVKRAIVVLLLVACARHETPTPPPQGQARVPVLHRETKETKGRRLVVPKPRGVSTPAKCAGDGSYEQAVECFRMSSGFRFRVASPAVTASGTLQRPRLAE